MIFILEQKKVPGEKNIENLVFQKFFNYMNSDSEQKLNLFLCVYMYMCVFTYTYVYIFICNPIHTTYIQHYICVYICVYVQLENTTLENYVKAK